MCFNDGRASFLSHVTDFLSNFKKWLIYIAKHKFSFYDFAYKLQSVNNVSVLCNDIAKSNKLH